MSDDSNGNHVRGVHLVGSFPLASNDEVFRVASVTLGDYLLRLPDGETGVRNGWLRFQRPVFADNSAFELGAEEPSEYGPHRVFRLREPTHTDELNLSALGYADAAIESYRLFNELRRIGVVPSHLRFQVCLPTPLAPVSLFMSVHDRALVEPAYEQQMLAELDAMLAVIPAAQLAIQWDVAVEVALLEGIAPTHLQDPWTDILERVVRLGQAVPQEVELGYHLCYGFLGQRHFKEPADLGLVVQLANAVAARSVRPLTWIHMPVPPARDDDGYFAPLDELRLAPETEVYLGLVDYHDGVAGAERRIAAARRHLPSFGVATECGLGQLPAERIPELLRIHAAVAAPRVRSAA
jgi:hypothetical protein